jgi:holo-[acyl-carrier protein] synthase
VNLPAERSRVGGGAPSVVGIGIDLADVSRVAAALRRHGGLAARLFTASERAVVDLGDETSVAQRFAAKEAVMKALGVGVDSVAFTDIELSEDMGSVVLGGRARRRASDVGAARWSVEVGVVAGPDGPVATAEVIASSSLR